jgi:hypothetical protein
MLQPGSKGWINKYFSLAEKKNFQLNLARPKGISDDHFLHLVLSNSGIVFGFPSELLFGTELNASKWTNEEKLKLLLFESHLLVFQLVEGDVLKKKDLFIESLLDFYGKHTAYSITKLFTFFLKEERAEKIENILSQRVELKTSFREYKSWFNYLSNAFVYFDIILYRDFLMQKKSGLYANYNEFAFNALTAITLAVYSNGHVVEREKSFFNVFLSSANLSDEQRVIAKERFKKGASFESFSPNVLNNWLFKRFLLDLSVLTIISDQDADTAEKEFLVQFCTNLKIPLNELDEALVMVEKFILNNNDQVSFLKTSSSYEQLLSSMTRRWIKILGRNKDKLAKELKGSKELVFLIKKSAVQELTKDEKEKVKTQFLDIVKTMPTLAIFMLPGGAILLPMVLKILPDLVPSAFRDNELDKE